MQTLMHTRSHTALYLLLGILGLSIPFSFNMDKAAIIVITIAGLGYAFSNIRKINVLFRNLLTLLPPIVYFIALLIGLTYSEDKYWGLKKIETSLPLLLLPLSVYMLITALNLKNLSIHIMVFFSLGNLIAITYAVTALTLSPPLDAIMSADFFALYSRDNLANFLEIHPIYLSLFNALSIQILLYLLLIREKDFNTLINAFWIFCIVCSFAFIVLLGAKMALIATIVTIIIWLTIHIINKKQYVIGIVLTLLLLSITIISVRFVPNIKKRFEEIADTNLHPPKGLAHNSTNLRVGQFYCSLSVIQDNPIFGAGTGDYQHELNDCYEQRGYSDVLYQDNYNSHNQYLQSWIMMGVLGIISILSLIIVPIIYAVKSKDYLIITCMIVIFFSFLTESYLLVNKGVIVFSFFYTLFIIRHFENRIYFSDLNHPIAKHR